MNARQLLELRVKHGHDTEAAEVLLNDDSDRHDRLLHALTTLGWWVLISVIAACAMCCASPQRVGRSISEENSNAVMIQGVGCEELPDAHPTGSGVIVGDYEILTADHVVKPAISLTDAAGNEIMKLPLHCTFMATTSDGRVFPVVLDHAWPDHDVARVLAVAKLPFTPVELASVPADGERVCLMARFPSIDRKCGDVQPDHYPGKPGDVHVSINVEPGNSGSGVYDNRGRLIGITTHLVTCVNGDFCGGRFSSIEGLGVMP